MSLTFIVFTKKSLVPSSPVLDVFQGMQLNSMKGDLLSVDCESSEDEEMEEEEEDEEEAAEERVVVAQTSKTR